MPKYAIVNSIMDTYDTPEEALDAARDGSRIGYGLDSKTLLVQLEVVGVIEMKPALAEATVSDKVFTSHDEYHKKMMEQQGQMIAGGMIGATANQFKTN